MSESERRRIRPSEAVYAFVPTISDAHAVASHIVLSFGLETMVGFNESSRGEGYVMVDPAVDISSVVTEVTGSNPLRVVSWTDIENEPDGFGVPQNI
jgi:hypothetical protein